MAAAGLDSLVHGHLPSSLSVGSPRSTRPPSTWAARSRVQRQVYRWKHFTSSRLCNSDLPPERSFLAR